MVKKIVTHTLTKKIWAPKGKNWAIVGVMMVFSGWDFIVKVLGQFYTRLGLDDSWVSH